MNKYVFQLSELDGSDMLEFRKGNTREKRKFQRADSLYVLDNAFYFFLEAIFKEVIASFDMFEDTYISKKQWDDIMGLNIVKITDAATIRDAQETLYAINSWAECHIEGDEGFTVIGV